MVMKDVFVVNTEKTWPPASMRHCSVIVGVAALTLLGADDKNMNPKKGIHSSPKLRTRTKISPPLPVSTWLGLQDGISPSLLGGGEVRHTDTLSVLMQNATSIEKQ